MALALDTCLVALYGIVDALDQSHIAPRMPTTGGPTAQLSAAEGRCLGLAVQGRRGVPWQSAPGMLRSVRKQLSHLFPTVLTPSALNRRWRRLGGAFILR